MLNLLAYRVRVLVDENSNTTGMIVENNLRNYCGLLDRHPSGDPEIPDDPPTQHNHIAFIKELTTEVEIDGETYLVMGINAIVGYIT